MKIRKEVWFLVGILIFGFFLRVYSLGVPALWIDEAISSVASSNILEKGLPVFDSGLLYSRAFVFHYIQAGFLIFGNSDFLVRFISVIFGLGIIILGYFIGKEYSKSGGVFCALFLAVFYLEVFYSRQARFYQMFQFFFFLSLYLLYKSKENLNYLWFALVSFFIVLDTQIAGLILAPFFILHILIYQKQKWISVIPLIPLVWKFVGLFNLVSDSGKTVVNYAVDYSSYFGNMIYVWVLFIPGLVWSFKKNKDLSLFLILPSLSLVGGVFLLKLFAFRYVYFFVFPLVIYFALFLSFAYEKYGKIILIGVLILLVVPSNLFFPYTYTNVILPVNYNYNDYSAPAIDYKEIPLDVLGKLKVSDVGVLFSPSLEWYVKKPTWVFDFSLSGDSSQSLNYNGKDVYSGAEIIDSKPSGEFMFVVSDFAFSKLDDIQKAKLGLILNGCEVVFEGKDLDVWDC